MTFTIDRAGRVVIPKGIREQMNWTPGAELILETKGEEVIIKRADTEPSLSKVEGLLVHHGGEVGDIDIAGFVRSQREGVALDKAKV